MDDEKSPQFGQQPPRLVAKDRTKTLLDLQNRDSYTIDQITAIPILYLRNLSLCFKS